MRRRLRPAAEAAAVPWVTPHVFRHSLATGLRDGGYEGVIAKILGHPDEAFTRRVSIHTKDRRSAARQVRSRRDGVARRDYGSPS